MKLIDRFIILVFALILVVFGAGAIMSTFNASWVSGYLTIVIEHLFQYYRWYILFAGAACVIIGMIILFTSAFRSTTKTHPKLLTAGEVGDDIQISVGAINTIIEQTTKTNLGVEQVSTSITQDKTGICLVLTLTVKAGENLTQLVNWVQDRVKSQLENMAGLKVSKLKVVVSEVSPVVNIAEGVEIAPKEEQEAV